MKQNYVVTGMTCSACSARVEKVTRALEGVQRADVNLLAGTMVVEAASDAVVTGICAAVEKAGLTVTSVREKEDWRCITAKWRTL